jgi:hypothetical protein
MDLREELEVERKMVVKYGNELDHAVNGRKELESELDMVRV